MIVSRTFRTPLARWTTGAAAVLLLAATAAPTPAVADAGKAGPGARSVVTATSTALSTGPLTEITVSPTLNCLVHREGDAVGEWFGETACGTLLAVGGVLYSPGYIPAGDNATNASTPWTPVDEAEPTGDGTPGSPLTIVTTVAAGSSGLTLKETDSYVIGSSSYRTDLQLDNAGSTDLPVVLYRAGDCYQGDDDNGAGRVSGTSVACLSSERVEQFQPLTPGSHYRETRYATLWAAIATQQPFDNTCTCDVVLDNSIGLSWTPTVPAGGTVTIAHLNQFSAAALSVTTTADVPFIRPSGPDGYTVTINNPRPTTASLGSISVALPAGFLYAGPTTGVTESDPAASGQLLTWSGPFSAAPHSPVSLHVPVTASHVAGTYDTQAAATVEGTGTDDVVSPSGPSARIEVSADASDVTAVAGDGQATVSWIGPETASDNPVTGYAVRAYAGSLFRGQKNFDASATTRVFAPLLNGVAYTFRVEAVTVGGLGPLSSPSAPVTPRGPPGAPASVVAVPGPSSVLLTWQPPSSSNGAPVDGYVVTPLAAGVPGAPVTLSGDTTSQVFTGLRNGTSYVFQVAARNVAGVGLVSSVSNSVTPRTLPGAPTEVSVSLLGTTATVSWARPADDGGAPITQFDVTPYVGTSPLASHSLFGSASRLSVSVASLTNGVTYTFRVTATNLTGTGPASTPSGEVTPSVVASAPTDVFAAAAAGSARMTWTAPTSTGGVPVTSYQVVPYRGTRAGTPVTFAGPATAGTVRGLTNGGTYTFRVRALNAAGSSPLSKASNPVKPSATTQDWAAAVAYDGWSGVTGQGASGGAFRRSDTAGAVVGFSFSGTSVRALLRRGPDAGLVDVVLDGVARGPVDLYSPVAGSLTSPYPGLAKGPHTLLLTVAGSSAAASRGTGVGVDGFYVGTATKPLEESAPAASIGGWTGVAAAAANGGTYRLSTVPGALATFGFEGTGVAWVSAVGPTLGQAAVSVDGAAPTTVDLYAPARAFRRTVFSVSALTAGPHTLTVRVLGTRQSAATGVGVAVDAFTVR